MTRYHWSLGRVWQKERKLAALKDALGGVFLLACIGLLYVWAGVMQP